MNNSLDQYSKPIKQEKTKLSTIYWFNSRNSKKGRSLIPVYDERYPLKFSVKYAYLVKFFEKDNEAGNHYHHVKEEILVPLQGSFDILFEDVNTKEREVISLKGKDNQGAHVKTGVSHKVVSKEEDGLLLVLASSNSEDNDEIEYDVS